MAYEDDGALACLNCGRTLAIHQPKRSHFRTVRIEHEKRGKPSPYPPELKAICIEWLLEGESVADVKYASGVGEATLLKWLKVERKRLGLSRPAHPSYSIEFKTACAKRLLAGETLETLSEETGVKVATLREWRLNARRGFWFSSAN